MIRKCLDCKIKQNNKLAHINLSNGKFKRFLRAIRLQSIYFQYFENMLLFSEGLDRFDFGLFTKLFTSSLSEFYGITSFCRRSFLRHIIVKYSQLCFARNPPSPSPTERLCADLCYDVQYCALCSLYSVHLCIFCLAYCCS